MTVPPWLLNMLGGLLGALLPVVLFFVRQYVQNELLKNTVNALHKRVDELEVLIAAIQKTTSYLEIKDEVSGVVRDPRYRGDK